MSALIPALFALSACSGSSSPAGASGTGSAAASSSAGSVSGPADSSSNVGLSSAAVQKAINAAAKTATAVLVKGSVTESGETITMNLQLNAGSASGTLEVGSTAIPFISVGDTTYMQFTSGLITMIGDSLTAAQGKLLLNKWVSSKTSLGSSIASSFTGFTSLSAFLNGVVAGTGSTYAAKGGSTLNGRSVALYTETDTDNSTSTLYLPASGPALPIQSVGGSDDPGTITFSWNAPTKVTAPPSADIYTG